MPRRQCTLSADALLACAATAAAAAAAAVWFFWSGMQLDIAFGTSKENPLSTGKTHERLSRAESKVRGFGADSSWPGGPKPVVAWGEGSATPAPAPQPAAVPSAAVTPSASDIETSDVESMWSFSSRRSEVTAKDSEAAVTPAREEADHGKAGRSPGAAAVAVEISHAERLAEARRHAHAPPAGRDADAPQPARGKAAHSNMHSLLVESSQLRISHKHEKLDDGGRQKVCVPYQY